MKKNKQKTLMLLKICCAAVALFVLPSSNLFAKPCPTTSSNVSIVACDSFRVGGDKFTESGIYVIHLTNHLGCDSTLTLNLTINVSPSAPMLTSTVVCGEGVDTLKVLQIGRVNMPILSAFTWYDAAVDGNIVGTGEMFITPNLTQTTVYFATFTYMGCESPRAGVEATVNFIPSTPYIETPAPVCKEGVFTFDMAIPSRINCRNCDPFDYEWQNETGEVVSTDASYTTPIINGTSAYYGTISYNGCKSESAQVWAEVLNIPKPQLNNLPTTCAELPAQVQVANMTPFRVKDCRGCGEIYDYTWYNANGDSIATNSSFITPVLSNTTPYSVKASDRGCYSESLMFDVLVSKIKPAITQSPASVYICVGPDQQVPVGFKIKATGDDLQYAYGFTQYDEILSVYPLEHDTIGGYIGVNFKGFGIVLLVGNACGIDTSDIAYFNINNMIEVTSVTKSGNTLTATSNTDNASFQWYDCATDQPIDGANSASFTPTVSGGYFVRVYDELTCNEYAYSEGCTDVDLTTTGLTGANALSFSIYPNPATDFVNVTLSSAINGTVSITDINGIEVINQAVAGSEFKVSTADLSSGVYILKVSSSTLTVTKQIAVVK